MERRPLHFVQLGLNVSSGLLGRYVKNACTIHMIVANISCVKVGCAKWQSTDIILYRMYVRYLHIHYSHLP